jgi:hypothetical protein
MRNFRKTTSKAINWLQSNQQKDIFQWIAEVDFKMDEGLWLTKKY